MAEVFSRVKSCVTEFFKKFSSLLEEEWKDAHRSPPGSDGAFGVYLWMMLM